MTDKKPPSTPASAPPGVAETGFFEDVVRWARGKTSAGVDRGLTDMAAQASKFFYTLTYGDIGKPGDQRFGQDISAQIDQAAMKYGRPPEFGNYDLMMAAGWHPKGEIKVNGKMTTLDKPVENMLAVFVRNKDGSVELLDPTIKVTSLGEVPLLVNALLPESAKKSEIMMKGLDDKYKEMMRVDTPSDQKWRDTAGTFVLTQLGPMAIGSGLSVLGAAGKAVASKFTQVEKAVDIAGKVNSAAVKATVPLVASTATSGLTEMGAQLSQSLYFTPEAIKSISTSISKTLNAPEITASSVRHNLNESLHEFSFNQGSDAKQIYIPSLRDSQQPWTRFQQVLQGVVVAHEKLNHPWEKWSDEKRISETGIRDALRQSPGINHAFYSSVEKHLSGKPLTDRDVFVLRAGMKIGPENSLAAAANINPVGKSGDLKFTAEERAQTIKYLDDQLQIRLLDKAFDNSAVAKKFGVDINDPAVLVDKKFTPEQIKTFVSDEVKTYGAVVNADLKQQTQQITARVASPGMGL